MSIVRFKVPRSKRVQYEGEAVMTLLPGEVIATGTPASPGPPEPGDRVDERIDGIDSLENPVI